MQAETMIPGTDMCQTHKHGSLDEACMKQVWHPAFGSSCIAPDWIANDGYTTIPRSIITSLRKYKGTSCHL